MRSSGLHWNCLGDAWIALTYGFSRIYFYLEMPLILTAVLNLEGKMRPSVMRFSDDAQNKIEITDYRHTAIMVARLLLYASEELREIEAHNAHHDVYLAINSVISQFKLSPGEILDALTPE